MHLHLSITKENILIGLLSSLWLLVLLPKTMQFAVYAVILTIMIWNRRIALSGPEISILAGCSIQSVAIITQVLTRSPEQQRVMAAINTTMIWVIAVMLYSLCKEVQNKTDVIEKMAKAARLNMIILFLLYLFSLVYHSNTIQISGMTYYLRRNDYLSSGSTTRFCGLMETVLGPSHLFFVCTPILMLDNDNRLKRRNLLAAILGYISVLATHSRIGLLCASAALMIMLYSYMTRKFGHHLKTSIILLVGMIAISVALYYKAELMTQISDLFNARGGSNSARFAIYEQSLSKMWSESPVIGIGIKYMLGAFPYGSHCTYIGLLYKAGFLGAFFFLFGIYQIIYRIGRQISDYSWHLCAFFIILLYFVFLIFADLDGSDWVIISMFLTWGFLGSKETQKENKTVTAAKKAIRKEVLVLG